MKPVEDVAAEPTQPARRRHRSQVAPAAAQPRASGETAPAGSDIIKPPRLLIDPAEPVTPRTRVAEQPVER